MSIHEPQNQDKTTEEAGVEKRRRFIKGAGIAAPVVLSLANRTAFGQEECLSQQVSGNTSGNEGSCETGSITPTVLITSFSASPPLDPTYPESLNITSSLNKISTVKFVGKTGNHTLTVVTKRTVTPYDKWAGTTIKYGDLTLQYTKTIVQKRSNYLTGSFTVTPDSTGTFNGTKIAGQTFTVGEKNEYINTDVNPVTKKDALLPVTYKDFTSGATFFDLFGYGSTDPIRKILNENPDSVNSWCIAAMFNALTNTNFVLDVTQLKKICQIPPDPNYPIPGGDLKTFLISTMT